MSTINTHTLSVLVEDKPGVLARVASLFSRRGFNIQSLAVGATEQKDMSRMTIVVSVEDSPLEQITKQLFKLIHVIKISELAPGEGTERELCLVSVRADQASRSHVIELVQVFEGKIVDVGLDQLTVMLAGTPSKIDDFEDLMRQYGIVDMQRTGLVALPKLERQARLRSVASKAG